VVENPPQLVSQFLDALELDGDAAVTVESESMRLADALATKLEITAPSLGVLRAWSEHSDSDVLRSLLDGEPDSQARLSEYLETHQIIDVLRQNPANVDAQSFVDSLRKLSPRSYSIASSQAENPDEVHLTVAPVRYESFGSEHWGAASTQLADRLAEGDAVSVYVEPNPRFRLPADDSTSIIMIGPGTGIAPFRAFVEERAARAATGKNWLFFGDRNFSSDFLYQLEWQRNLKQGKLERLDVAFSRDQEEKIYVQDRILQNGADVHAWIESGAHIYVCGDAKRMAGDVDAALVDVLVNHGGVTELQAQSRLKELRRAGRYQRDVY
jgi:sulfite reductase (NADPH) flavoprotein alpha-component